MSTSPGSRWLLGLSTAALVFVALRLGAHADSLSIWSDETWSVFHGGRTVFQILQERDLLWPFGYYLALHGWMQVTGTENDFALHALGVFSGLMAAAFLIRIGRTWRMPWAGLLAALAFGTSSYALYFSLELRGYTLMLLLESAFFCFYFRWLRNPSLRRSLPLLLTMMAMPYIHFILGVTIAGATSHLLLTQPRLVGRWAILIGLVGLAFLPLLPQAWRGFELAIAAGRSGPLPSLFRHGLDSFYRAHSAHWDVGLAIVLAVAIVGLPWGVRKLTWPTLAWLLAFAVGIPLGAYVVRDHFAFFTTRHLAFTIPSAVLLLGAGLSSFPKRWLAVGALGALALARWQPFDHRPSDSDFPPVRDFMRAMAQDFMPGDRLVIDPLLKGLPSSMEWSYYKSVYFRQGDFRLSENDAAPERRIWYLSRQGSEDPAVSSWARVGRIQTAAWGPWYLHASLLEAPPDELGVRVGEDLRFLGTDVDRRADVHAGDILPIRLWWAADFPTPADFPVRLELYDSSGSLVADVETLPRSPDAPVRQGILNPGDLLMDSRWVEVPYHLDDGMYTLRLTAWPGEGDTLPSSGGSLVIDRFHLASFATW